MGDDLLGSAWGRTVHHKSDNAFSDNSKGGSMNLNLACGDRQIKGYTNVDYYVQADEKVDLFSLPWPWADSTAEEIRSSHYMEHVPDFIGTLKEIRRVLKPGGIARIIVPHHRSCIAPLPVYHLHEFSAHAFKALFDGWAFMETSGMFETVSIKHRLYRCLKPIEWLANLAPIQYEKLAFTPTFEIEWIGRSTKGASE